MGRPIDLDDVDVGRSNSCSATPPLTAQVIHVDNGQRLAASARDVMFDTRPNGES